MNGFVDFLFDFLFFFVTPKGFETENKLTLFDLTWQIQSAPKVHHSNSEQQNLHLHLNLYLCFSVTWSVIIIIIHYLLANRQAAGKTEKVTAL